MSLEKLLQSKMADVQAGKTKNNFIDLGKNINLNWENRLQPGGVWSLDVGSLDILEGNKEGQKWFKGKYPGKTLNQVNKTRVAKEYTEHILSQLPVGQAVQIKGHAIQSQNKPGTEFGKGATGKAKDSIYNRWWGDKPGFRSHSDGSLIYEKPMTDLNANRNIQRQRIGAEITLDPDNNLYLSSDQKTKGRELLGRKLEAFRDLEEQKLGRPLTEPELSNTRKAVNKVFVDGVEQKLQNVRNFFRTYKNDKVNTTWPGLSPIEKESKSTTNLTTKERRKFKTTGVIDGEMAIGGVIRQARDLDETPEKWGIDPRTREPKSVKGFIQHLTGNYSTTQLESRLEGKRTNVTHHSGHGLSAEDFGPNTAENLGRQPAYIDYGGKVANVTQGGTTLKDINDLKSAGINFIGKGDPNNISAAFNEYLMKDDPDIQKYSDIPLEWRSKGLHDPSITATGAEIEGRRRAGLAIQDSEIRKVNPRKQLTDEDKVKLEILAKNPAIPDTRNVKGPVSYFDKIKSSLRSKGFQREALRLAGQSPNPIMNIAGDFVGTIYDGVAVAANPKDKKAITELIMSGTQLGTSIVGGVLIAVPDPLTGGLGYAIMRAGDKVGQLERLWNMNREGIAGKTRVPDIQGTVSGDEVAAIRADVEGDLRIEEPSFDARKALNRQKLKL